MNEEVTKKLKKEVGIVNETIKELNNSNIFKEAQKTLKEHAERMAEITKEMHPYLEKIKDLQSRNKYELEGDILLLKSNKTKEHLILEELEEIKSDLKDIKDSKKVKVVRESYPLPEGATWEKLYIKFVDGHTVKVRYEDLPQKTFDYKDMGFLDRKTNNPDNKWGFILRLAENNGRITNLRYNKKFNRNTKYEVCKRLKNFFRIEESPINNYTKKEGYLALFNISPEREDRHLIEEEI